MELTPETTSCTQKSSQTPAIMKHNQVETTNNLKNLGMQ